MAAITRRPRIVSETAFVGLDARCDRPIVTTANGVRLAVPVMVNRVSAAAFARTVRRVTTVHIDPNEMTALAQGIGNRIPFSRQIPVSMALGLAERGVATTVAAAKP